jgi:anaerobic selenocysteine-containing dehydrogenase
VLVHPLDIDRLQLQPEQHVSVKSDVGRLDNIRVVAFDRIKPGNALMYFPEANVLVDRVVDPSSRTPTFKGGLITLEV